MEEFWLANNTICLCETSLCFNHDDITLYKISRHFFFFCLINVENGRR